MNVGFIGQESVNFLLARVDIDSDNHVTFACVTNYVCVISCNCECGNEPSGSTKCGEFLDKLKTG